MNKADELGHKAHDTITGFTGTITGIATYLTGCMQYLIESDTGEDKDTKSRWFDDSRVKVAQSAVTLPEKDMVTAPGGPQSNAPRR